MESRDESYRGSQGQHSGTSEFNALSFLIKQILNSRNVATLVQVKAVTNAGGLSPVGYVDVLPLVNQLDGARNAIAQPMVHNLPYFRLQGGSDAIILDPKVGDIGLAVFADRDISSVKANKAAANPASMRRSDMADGLYVGGFLNGTPTQFVRFSAAGINITSPVAISMNAPDISMTAPTIEMNASTGVTINTPQVKCSGDLLDNYGTNSRTIAGMRAQYNSHTHSDPQGGSVSTPSTTM